MSDSKEKLIQMLLSKGYQKYFIPNKGYDLYQLSRAVDGPKCDCNDRKPAINVKIWDQEYYRKVIIEVLGEKKGLWSKQSVFELSFEEVLERFDEICEKLTRMWNAFCE